jgi:putative restriction endonuclease
MNWSDRLDKVRRWSRNGERAPHKPLLLLYALGRFQAGVTHLAFSEVEPVLARLLRDYGPPRTTSAAYPFHHLTSDGLWEVRTDSGAGSPGAVKGQLLAGNAVGALAADLLADLSAEPWLIPRLARQLLDTNFPTTLHADICIDVGIELELIAGDLRNTVDRRRRGASHKLRDLAFTAYEYRCAFCGFDGLLGGRPVGLEAAHLRWWSHGGSDQLDNLICLCAMHHKLLDQGVFGISEDRRILVSRQFVARSPAGQHHVLDLAGQPMIEPQPGSDHIHARHILWHSTQVFKDLGRAAPVYA